MIIVVVLIASSTIIVITGLVVAYKARKKMAFERRHRGFTSAQKPSPDELLARRGRRLEEYWKACGGILKLDPSAFRVLLERGSYWHRARRDMLTLYASAARAIVGVMSRKDHAASVELLELKMAIQDRSAICRSCLEVNKKRLGNGQEAICELEIEMAELSTAAGGDGGSLSKVSYDIGPDGELQIRQ